MDMLASHKMVKHKAKGKDLNNDKVSFFLAPKKGQKGDRQATEKRKGSDR